MATDDISKYANYGLSRLSDFVTAENGTWGQVVKTESPSFLNTPKDSKEAKDITIEEQQAYTPSLNWAKVWRIRFGLYGGWDNWRSSSINHIVNVDKNIFLISEKSEVAMDLKYKYDDVSLDKMTDFGGIDTVKKVVKGAASLASTASGFLGSGMDGMMTSTYGGLKGLKGIEPLSVPGSLTFTFYFGQAGLYDATKEVMLPVLALVGCTAPYNSKYSHMFRGQVPSVDYLLGQMLKSIVDNGKTILHNLSEALASEKPAADSGSSGGSSGGGDTDLIDKALDGAKSVANKMIDVSLSVNDTIYGAIDGIYSAVLGSSSNRMAYFKLGVMEIGPCYVDSTSFTFDFSATDSNGMPTKGTVTFGGITTPLLSTAANVRKMVNVQFSKANMIAYGSGYAGLKAEQEVHEAGYYTAQQYMKK